MSTPYPEGIRPVIVGVSCAEMTIKFGGTSPFLAYTMTYVDPGENILGASRVSNVFSPRSRQLLLELRQQLERDFIIRSATPLHERADYEAFPTLEDGVPLDAPDFESR